MADGKVNITFETIAQMRGLNQISDGIKKSARGIKDFGDAGSRIVGELSAQFKGPMMDAIGSVFGSLQGLARGGLWGIIAQQVSSIIGKFAEWHKTVEAIREEDRKMYANRARNAEAYARRVASYAEKAAQKEKDALEARAKAHSKMVDTIVKNNAALADAESRIRDAQRRQGVAIGERDELTAGNEGRSETARDAVEAARQAAWAVKSRMEAGLASAAELQVAEKKLAAAEAELAAVEAENAKRLRDRALAEETAAGEAQRKAEEDFARQLREEEAAEKRKNINALKKQVTVLDQAIVAQKKLAAAWEESARKARGKDFATWLAETEAEEKARDEEKRRFGRANAGAGRRAQNIRNRGFWASARDKAWLARYDEWNAAQDPANNSAAKEAEKLEKERAEKVASIAKVTDEIKALLSKAVTME